MTHDSTETKPAGRPAPKWLNPACEYGPLAVFFVTYLVGDLFQATAAVMVATLIALIASYAITRTWPKLPLVTAPILLIMGGLTLYLEDETFIKIRPTLVNGLFCVILAASVFFNKQPLKFLMGQALDMTDAGWRKLTLRFSGFFLFLAVMNEIVWRTQSDDFWVTYKVFGAMGLTFAFMLSQTPMISRHMREQAGSDSADSAD
ncbi:MAG: septation protein A [Alphaproteobacteria bacterium]|nr:septation protein A [Alphaproteobacteria bacterium]